jgi:membrane protein DedA with SNARE-associated domain
LPYFFLPSKPILFIFGAVWASSMLNIWLLIAVVILAAALGNISGYFFGKMLGKAFFVDFLKWLTKRH